MLIIGFGRFGQIVSQPLLLRGIDVSIIDNDVEMIQAAADFGFKVYYGDGTRLDILHAAGAGRARAVLICVDKAETADPHRREHEERVSLRAGAGAGLRPRRRDRADQRRRRLPDPRDIRVGAAVRRGDARTARRSRRKRSPKSIADVRHRDDQRLELQIAGDIQSGRRLMKGNIPEPVPTPLTQPKRPGQAMNEEAADALGKATAD